MLAVQSGLQISLPADGVTLVKVFSSAGTFHSVGCQIVRRNIGKLGDTGRQPFAIFDQDDTKNVMKLALKKHFSLKRGVATEADMAADDEADDSPDEPAQLREWVRS